MTAICFKCGHPPHDGSCVNVAPQQPTAQPFTVVAGKIEGDGEHNYKYVESFADVMDAVRALDTCKGYHFAEIEYRAAPPAPVSRAELGISEEDQRAAGEAVRTHPDLKRALDEDLAMTAAVIAIDTVVRRHADQSAPNEGGSEPVANGLRGWKIQPDEEGWRVVSPSGDGCYLWDADARHGQITGTDIRKVFRQLCSSLIYAAPSLPRSHRRTKRRERANEPYP
ncbi:hypothetical protein [Cupriavidus sp. D39]|uniref:hypothetical protein n=1 Tax=Cupriavidus sp. D39 TaxID=2997877 RepID=UPI0022703D4F|nr:hypothetical protein [Cupriavidus sp. D39]MCY0854312.1 hypothetical protein [Cupriavidus sp. D39]